MKYLFIYTCFFFCTSSSAQIITTVAGTGVPGYSGNGGPATLAQLNLPNSLDLDNAGNLYIADRNNNVIRKIDASTGTISVFAGTGAQGHTGDGGPATLATFDGAFRISFDGNDNLFVTDGPTIIRKIDPAGIITTVANGGTTNGYSGDGGPLSAAEFGNLSGIGFDNAGNMYLTDFAHHVIRKVNTAGIISTFAGNGIPGFSGDGGPATSAQLWNPYRVIADNAGNIYIPEAANNRIRKVAPNGIITTFAGNGIIAYLGDGGPAINASFSTPWQIDIDNSGNIYVADVGNFVVRKIDTNGMISTVAGNGTYGYSGDGGPAVLAQFNQLRAIACNATGSVFYVADGGNVSVVRKITNCATATTVTHPQNVILCNSGNASFTCTASNVSGGYQWQVNTGSGWVNLVNNASYAGVTSNSLSVTGANASMNLYQYRCALTNGCGTVYTQPAYLNVNIAVTPSISISASPTSICQGTPVTFTATPVNGGAAPVHQWKKNGINAGTNSPTYTDNSLTNTDQISCVLTSSANCITASSATSNLVSVTVNPLLTPSVSIAASANNVCAGTTINFNAVPVNGGASPTYQWKKNGSNVGTNAASYSANNLVNGDIITCVLSSNATCLAQVTASSNSIVMNITPLSTPSVSISTLNQSICAGAVTSFTAQPGTAGTVQTYQWKKNGNNVGTNSATYSDNAIANGDIITCFISVTGNCLTGNTATSNAVNMTVYTNPVPELGNINSICESGSITLNPGTFSSYVWNNGSTASTFTVNGTGSCYVTVKDIHGCAGSDTVHINTLLPKPKNFLPDDLSICTYGTSELAANASFKDYLWNTGQHSNAITIRTPGTYWLEVTDNNNCKGRDTLNVLLKQCLTGFYIPTAFTPNANGINDEFKPKIFGNLGAYRLSIYNRYGQPIFETSDINKGWDGTQKGAAFNTGSFVWICRFELEGKLQVKKGTVLLLK